jgi:hypothetical protein
MAGKGRERFEKRQREQDRRKKAAAKRERRSERQSAREAEGDAEGPTESELLEQVHALHERHAAGKLTDEQFEEQRAELFAQLGLD